VAWTYSPLNTGASFDSSLPAFTPPTRFEGRLQATIPPNSVGRNHLLPSDADPTAPVWSLANGDWPQFTCC
jgi:hypothetical protein